MTLSSQINEFYKGAEKYFNITRKDLLDEVLLPDGIVTFNIAVLQEELEKRHGELKEGDSLKKMILREYGEEALVWLNG